MILLDTSFIVAFDNEKDVHYKRAREIWVRIEAMEFGQYFISDYIFDEVIAVSLRKTNKEGTINLGQTILKTTPIVNIDNHLFNESWRLFKVLKQNLSFTDCTCLVLLKLTDTKKIATFDKSFKELKEIEVVD